VWRGRAAAHLGYARDQHAAQGRVTPCLGLVAVAATEYAHALLAARGEWVTNEKRLLTRAGLGEVDDLLLAAGRGPASLAAVVDGVRALADAVDRA
jgi:hypothetical protein